MANSNDRQLKSPNVKNNCSAFQSTNFVIDSKTKLKDDVCNENGDNKHNSNINDYMLSNYSSCDCSLDKVLKTATNNNGIIIDPHCKESARILQRDLSKWLINSNCWMILLIKD